MSDAIMRGPTGPSHTHAPSIVFPPSLAPIIAASASSRARALAEHSMPVAEALVPVPRHPIARAVEVARRHAAGAIYGSVDGHDGARGALMLQRP